MTEKITEQIAFRKTYGCDETEKCTGEMQQTGHVRQEKEKDVYLHRCTVCGKSIDLPKQYPSAFFVSKTEAAQLRKKPRKNPRKKAG